MFKRVLQTLGEKGIYRPRIKLVKIMAGVPRLEQITLSKTSAVPGDTVRISAHAMDAQGLYLSPYGDPSYMTYIRKSPSNPDCVGNYPDMIVYADYKVRSDAPDGMARMALAIRDNTGGVCNGSGNTRDHEELYVRISAAAPAPAPEPAPAPGVTPCSLSDFTTSQKVYQCGGTSPCLNSYCEQQGRGYTLTVYGNPSRAELYGPTQPPARSCEESIIGWENGYEMERKYCSKDGNYYWVTYPAQLTPGEAAAEPCTASSFTKTDKTVYTCGGASTCLNQHCEDEGKEFRLTIFPNPTRADLYGPTRPPARSCEESVAGWESGYELTRELCSGDGNYYWVTYPASLEEVEVSFICKSLLGQIPLIRELFCK